MSDKIIRLDRPTLPDPEESRARRAWREQEEAAFQQRTRDYYAERAEREARWGVASNTDPMVPIAELLPDVERQALEVALERLATTPPNFTDPGCMTCRDDRLVRMAWKNGTVTYAPCPDCLDAMQAEQKARLNRRWPLSEWDKREAGKAWEHRDTAPGAMVAREKQKELLAEMPSATTLFLYGNPGTGKSRLLAEIAVAARERGLTSILRTAERLRQILQAFPKAYDRDDVKADKERRLQIATEDLRSCDVLLIDEIDHALGDAIGEMFLELINHRISTGLTTCVAGNDALSALPAPIVSRLRARNSLYADLTHDEDARPWLGHGLA